ncbi:MAG: O-antigen ligase family protein [Patescibacteria group bacterium]
MLKQKVSWSFLISILAIPFTVWLLVSSFFSISPYNSFVVVGIWCWCVVAAWLGFCLQRSRSQWMEVFVHALIVLAVIAAFFSIYTFYSQPEMLSYPRMRGFFDTHNVYAAFLIFPMLAAWRYVIKSAEENKLKMWMYGTAAAILVSQFILTFSRGMWLATAAAALVFVIIHSRNGGVKLLLDRHKVRVTAVSVFIVGVILSFGLYWGAILSSPTYTSESTPSLSPYATETVIENGITARLNYMRDGITLARSNLITGVGPGMYDDALKQSKRSFEFYSAHSHNSLINLLVETGVIGMILGLLILLGIGGLAVSVLKRYIDNGLYGIAAFSVIAVLFHSLVDADFEYALIVIVLSIVVGSLAGFMALPASLEKGTVFNKRFAIIGIGILLLATLAHAGSSYYLKQAQKKISTHPVEALRLVDVSAMFLPFSATQDVVAAEALTQIMLKAPAANIPRIGEDALGAIKRAHSKRECYARAYYDEFIVLNILDRIEESAQALRSSIDCAPTASHDQLLMLVRIQTALGNYAGALSVIDEFLPRYESFSNTGWFATHQFKDEITSTIASLRASRASLCQEHGELLGCGE